jgi:hypothetical protein
MLTCPMTPNDLKKMISIDINEMYKGFTSATDIKRVITEKLKEITPAGVNFEVKTYGGEVSIELTASSVTETINIKLDDGPTPWQKAVDEIK